MNMLNAGLFFLLFIVAGWSTFQLIFLSRQNPLAFGRSNAGDETSEGGASKFSFAGWSVLILLCALVVSSAALMMTAGFGFFKLRTILGLLGLYDGALLFYLCRRGLLHVGWPRCRSFHLDRSDVLALGLLCLAIAMFGRPSEIVFNSADSGVHVNIAMRIVETGSILSFDPDFQHIDRWEQQKLFLPVPLTEARNPKPFECFWVWNFKRGVLFPNLFTLLPLWLALAYKLGGFPALFYFNILLGLLSTLLLYFVGVKLFESRWVGFGAAVLLTVSMAQIWLVRSPFSEVFVQLLILGGIWLLAHGMELKSRSICAFAGMTFGLTLFVRPDSVLVLAGLALSIFLFGLARKAGNADLVFPQEVFLSGLKITSICALIYSVVFSYLYLISVLDAMKKGSHQWGDLVVVVIFLAVALALVLKFERLHSWVQDWNTSKRDKLILGIWTLLALSIGYLWLVRPFLPPYVYQPTMSFYDKISFRFYDELNLVRLGWYLTPLGLGLACAGCFLFTRRIFEKKGAWLLPFASLLLVFAGFYLYKSRARPFNYGVIRRYIEIVIPAAVLFAALTLESIGTFLSKRFAPKVGQLVGGILFLVVVAWQFHLAMPVLFKQEFKGSYEQIGILAEKNAAADILLFEDGNFKNYLPGPLKFIFHKSVYALQTQMPDPQAFDRLMEEWQGQGKRVHLLASEEHTQLASQHYDFVPIDRFLFQTSMVENPTDRMPQAMQDLTLPVQIYRVTPKVGAVSTKSSYKLQMEQSFGVASGGFYQAEREPNGGAFRWAGPESSLGLPAMDDSHDAWLLLRLSRPAPLQAPKATLGISFNQTKIGDHLLSASPEAMWLQIPRRLIRAAAANRLEFATTAFNLARLGVSPDVRELGFKLESVQVQSGGRFDWDLQDGRETNLSGFYGLERDDKNRDFRWTSGIASLDVPPLDDSNNFQLSLSVGLNLPRGVKPPSLQVFINHHFLGEKQLSEKEVLLKFRVPARDLKKGAVNSLQLKVPTFCLAKLGLGPDQRELGIKVYQLILEAESVSRMP
jgi:hypothetical protein